MEVQRRDRTRQSNGVAPIRDQEVISRMDDEDQMDDINQPDETDLRRPYYAVPKAV